MLMSSTITPNPEPNSAANSMARTIERLPCASGHSTSGAVNSRQPAVYAQPTPIRAAMRLVTAEPSSARCQHLTSLT